jgi:hypothetical protein
MRTGDIIEFNSSDSPIEIPDGIYQGQIVDTDFDLGSNSMDREWHTVNVISGDANIIGRQLTIYKQRKAATTTTA